MKLTKIRKGALFVTFFFLIERIALSLSLYIYIYIYTHIYINIYIFGRIPAFQGTIRWPNHNILSLSVDLGSDTEFLSDRVIIYIGIA